MLLVTQITTETRQTNQDKKQLQRRHVETEVHIQDV